jgi:hypothetical protein
MTLWFPVYQACTTSRRKGISFYNKKKRRANWIGHIKRTKYMIKQGT